MPSDIALYITPLSVIMIYTLTRYILKIQSGTLESKFVILNSILNGFLIATILIVFGIFDGNIIAVAVGLTPTLGSILYMASYIVKLIRIQRSTINDQSKKLGDVFRTGLDSSINVATSAAELAASSTEVNSTAEEIAATTMEVSLKAQNQTDYLRKISGMTQEIEIIAKAITSISEQTNLLALNASIEAGRAGEHGRGFAVVAEKVQKLAEEAKTSVEKTSDIVEKISINIQNAVEGSSEISKAMEEISSSTEEQTASMEEISATSEKLGYEAQILKNQLSQEEFTNMLKK